MVERNLPYLNFGRAEIHTMQLLDRLTSDGFEVALYPKVPMRQFYRPAGIWVNGHMVENKSPYHLSRHGRKIYVGKDGICVTEIFQPRGYHFQISYHEGNSDHIGKFNLDETPLDPPARHIVNLLHHLNSRTELVHSITLPFHHFVGGKQWVTFERFEIW